jgi:type I restriction enzyme M protein
MEYVHELNPEAVIRAFGQELNPESYAICKADMLIKGQDVSQIKLGNTLSDDQLAGQRFDYMLSNPPFGVDWKKIEKEVQDEHTLKGFAGRFGPGLPRVSDGSLLFLLHLLAKMRDAADGGGRIGIILNGSPLFTGGAGSGESEIRRYILEADLLEAIVALPTDMFYNTGIATYVWVLSNKKPAARKGQVQLINGVNLYSKMRKSLGSKRQFMDVADIATITRCFGAFEEVSVTDGAKAFAAKIFPTHAFGFRRITIERPLRESYQFSDERIATLRFDDKALGGIMQWCYENFGQDWSDRADCPLYGDLRAHEAEIRAKIKADFASLKEKQIKDLFKRQIWLDAKALMLSAKALQAKIGSAQHDDMNGYEATLKAAEKATGISLDSKAKKAIAAAVSWKNPEAEKVIKKQHKGAPDPLYGKFAVNGQVIEYASDSELRDYENVPLDPTVSVSELLARYFKAEVQPHVPEAWIDAGKTDAQDGEVGIVGYEIPFNRHFYVYTPPRPLEAIDADLDRVSAEIMALLQAVHS